MLTSKFLFAALALPTAATLAASSGASSQLPSGRTLTPVGQLAATPNFPVAVVATGNRIAVVDDGAAKWQSVQIYSARNLHAHASIHAVLRTGHSAASPGAVVAQGAPGPLRSVGRDVIPGQSLYQGLAWSADGRLYVTGGSSDNLLALEVQRGELRLTRAYRLNWQPFPASQYPYEYAGNWQEPRRFYPDSVVIGPHKEHAYVTGLLSNSLARINLASGATSYLNIGSYPFAVTLADDGERLVVSDWGGNGVTVVDRAAWKVLGEVPTGPSIDPRSRAAGAHPTALAAQPGTAIVWVADANIDRIVAVDTRSLRAVRVLDDAPYPGAPPGSYPDGLAISGERLFVANAGNDDVAVYDLTTGTREALIPTGWYPTAVAIHGHGLYVASAKGMGSGPNLKHQWVGDFMHGLLQRIDLRKLSADARAWTAKALADDGFSNDQRRARGAGNAKASAWLQAHIHHVVFILRENKTFDEDFGRYHAAGHWADPSLDLYGQRELPNLYRLASTSALFVHFYADGEVTSQGHQWTTAGSDSDFVQRTWPLYYSNRSYIANSGWTQDLVPHEAKARNPYAIYTNLSSLGHWSNPWVTYPGRLFLFDDLLAHHVDFEDFGEFAARNKIGNISASLRAHLAVSYPAWDRMILDTHRAAIADAWIRAHARDLPRVLYLWLPDDHTAGMAACMASPNSYVANNDEATAEVIHTLSLLPAWKHTLVLLTEDDAQSGADHIDAHRTLALAVGPWVRPGILVDEHLSQVDLLRTIEAIAGIPPMSQWDANAHVLGGIWRTTAHVAVEPVLPPMVRMERNGGSCSPRSPFRQWPLARIPDSSRIAWNGLPASHRYSPTALLKVSGAEQMRQEWLASKGPTAYAAEMARIHAMAVREQRPVQSLVAGDGAN